MIRRAYCILQLECFYYIILSNVWLFWAFNGSIDRVLQIFVCLPYAYLQNSMDPSMLNLLDVYIFAIILRIKYWMFHMPVCQLSVYVHGSILFSMDQLIKYCNHRFPRHLLIFSFPYVCRSMKYSKYIYLSDDCKFSTLYNILCTWYCINLVFSFPNMCDCFFCFYIIWINTNAFLQRINKRPLPLLFMSNCYSDIKKSLYNYIKCCLYFDW
jgi:hypothetical protein